MAKVERNVITPPNAHFQNLEARRSDTPRAFAPSPHLAKAQAQTGGFAPGGSADLSLRKSPVSPNVNRFNVSEAAMPQPPASVEPGTGTVPVNPFLASGPGIARAGSISDDAKRF